MIVLWIIGGLLSLSVYISLSNDPHKTLTVREMYEYALVVILGPLIFVFFCASLLTNIDYPEKFNEFLNTKVSDVPKFIRDLVINDEGRKE